MSKFSASEYAHVVAQIETCKKRLEISERLKSDNLRSVEGYDQEILALQARINYLESKATSISHAGD